MQQPLALHVLPFADCLLDGTPRSAGATAARAAMAERLRTSYMSSASQLHQRLLAIGAALRQVGRR